MVRVLIPELYREGRSQFLSQDEQRIFYEAGLRPAVERLQGDNAAEWPATYNDEMFRARGANGQLSFQTKVIADWLLPFLGDYIREALENNGYTWGTGLVFLHQIRGMKHSTSHSVNEESATKALEKFLTDNDLPVELANERSDWWLDIGVELASKDQQCLAFRTDSHYHIVLALFGISEDHARRITKPGSSSYTRDMASHLPQVSGCRIAPGSRSRGPFDIQYFQLYTTDKSLTYRPDGFHHGKFITCDKILKGKSKEYIDKLYELYFNATKTTYSLARVEMRVPIRFGTEALVTLDSDLMYDSLVSFAPEEWW